MRDVCTLDVCILVCGFVFKVVIACVCVGVCVCVCMLGVIRLFIGVSHTCPGG